MHVYLKLPAPRLTRLVRYLGNRRHYRTYTTIGEEAYLVFTYVIVQYLVFGTEMHFLA